MTPLLKSKLFGYAILVVISLMEIGLLSFLLSVEHLPEYIAKIFFITTFVILFNFSIWVWRHKYDSTILYYEEKDKDDDQTTK